MIILPQKIYFLGSLVIIFHLQPLQFHLEALFCQNEQRLLQCHMNFLRSLIILETDIWRSSPK
jgi:hypothetical protein